MAGCLIFLFLAIVLVSYFGLLLACLVITKIGLGRYFYDGVVAVLPMETLPVTGLIEMSALPASMLD